MLRLKGISGGTRHQISVTRVVLQGSVSNRLLQSASPCGQVTRNLRKWQVFENLPMTVEKR